MPYKRRRTDPLFRRAWDEASDIGTRLLEQEAQRRAFHGVLEPVFHKGIECGRVRKYSDALLVFILKARRPEKYRDGAQDGEGRKPSVINITIETVEEREGIRLLAGDQPVGLLEVVDVGSAGDKPESPGLPEAAAVPGE